MDESFCRPITLLNEEAKRSTQSLTAIYVYARFRNAPAKGHAALSRMRQIAAPGQEPSWSMSTSLEVGVTITSITEGEFIIHSCAYANAYLVCLHYERRGCNKLRPSKLRH